MCALVFLSSAVCAAFWQGCDTPPAPPKHSESLGARVELAAGDVFMKKGESAGDERLITGAMLPEEALVRVGAGGRALLRLSSGAGVYLRDDTEISLNGDSLRLQKGELWADVPSSSSQRDAAAFEAGKVRINCADSGVDISFDGKTAKVYVARGLAVVEAPSGRAEVDSGERAVVEGEAAPRVEPVDFWVDWTGGMADRQLFAGIGGRASGQIYGIDYAHPGGAPQAMQITFQKVDVAIRDGIAYTTVDQRFFNPSSNVLEGWYWFTVPEGAAVERFALEVDGQLLDGAMIERKAAAAAYEEAVRRAVDPALLEWVDARTFRARVYPLPAAGERRVVLSYSETLPLTDGVYRYVYPMAAPDAAPISEFSLELALLEGGGKMDIATLQQARVDEDGTKVTMRRSGFVPRSDFLVELRPKEKVDALRAARFSADDQSADYLILRYAPDVEWNPSKPIRGDVVVVVDTSAGGDDADRQVKIDAAEAVLKALSTEDRFAVVATDLSPRVVHPEKALAAADEKNVDAAIEALSEIEPAGATDLGAMFSVALDLLHDGEQPAVIYIGDGRPTVGETRTAALTERLRRALGDSRARLFTLGVGHEANHPLLERLSQVGGGRSFRIDTAEQAVQEALRFVGMLKTPTITDLEIDAGAGLDQLFSTATGKLSEGDEVIVLARSHHALPKTIAVKGRLAGEPFERTYEASTETGQEHAYIPVLWARAYLDRLMAEGIEENRGRIISLGLNYGLMTPLTSFLVLDSAEAYRQQGLEPPRRGYLSASDVADGPSGWSVLAALAAPLSLAGCSEDKAQTYSEAAAPAQLEQADALRAQMPPPQSEAPAAMADGEVTGMVKTEAAEPKMRSRKAAAPKKSMPMEELAEPMVKEKASEPEVADEGGGIERARYNERPSDQGVCSDASRRPLYQRRSLWQRRLDNLEPSHFARLFFEAQRACELPSWRHRKALLDLMIDRVRTPQAVVSLLRALDPHPALAQYVRQTILRRSLDPDIIYSIASSGGSSWIVVRQGLAAIDDPEKRLAQVREILVTQGEDPLGRALLVETLVEAGRTAEALSEALRMRKDDLAGPETLQILCDLQANGGDVAEAKRTCSEIVEYSPEDPQVRGRLGDLFLRHGWYEAAYRQYDSLVQAAGESPLALLRLAASAAGMGKIDEALRIERKVFSADGQPGEDDPRRWARLLSAARLAEMILELSSPGESGDKKQALDRSLKRTGLFGRPVELVILVWEDFDAVLSLASPPKGPGDEPRPLGRIHAPRIGLDALELPIDNPKVPVKVELRNDPGRTVGYALYTIRWDGNAFEIESASAEATPI